MNDPKKSMNHPINQSINHFMTNHIVMSCLSVFSDRNISQVLDNLVHMIQEEDSVSEEGLVVLIVVDVLVVVVVVVVAAVY